MTAFVRQPVRRVFRAKKADNVFGYKILDLYPSKGMFYSQFQLQPWKNFRMKLYPGTEVSEIGKGPGIYSYKHKKHAVGGYRGVVVKVRLYGKVVEYSGNQFFSAPGYMSQYAEIVEVIDCRQSLARRLSQITGIEKIKVPKRLLNAGT